ncbi:MAG: outer membrane beta-barrel protein [Cyclobacteriaceae bacterium]|nr:outer membrane beta-barrel protein [Cyclobacteriaceae bacterium]
MALIKNFVLVVLLLTVFAETTYAQRFTNRTRSRNLIVTGGIGPSIYYGDLAAKGDHSHNHMSFTAGARYHFHERFDLGMDMTFFKLQGDDSKDPIKAPRNLSFVSNNFEFSTHIAISLLPVSERFYLRPMFNPYVFAGVGFVTWSPMADLDGERYRLRPLQTEGVNYSAIAAVFPLGAGIKYRLNPFLSIVLEGAYRFTTTDYLDDVSSGIFPNPTSFDNPIARRLSDRSGEIGLDPPLSVRGSRVRGNPGRNDGYFLLHLKIEYFIGNLNVTGTQYRGNIRQRRPGMNRRRF